MREQSYKDVKNSQPNRIRGGETKVMRKLLNAFLVFALVLTMVTPAFAASTTEDLGDYASAVNRLSALKVLTGNGDGTFKVDSTITRAEFAAMAVRLLGLEAAAKASNGATPFKDGVADWAKGYVNVAVQQGIVTGYADGRFGEKDPVTQAQALAMLVRALGYEPQVAKEGWPTNYIVKAIELGLTDGVDSVTAYSPAKRGDVFKFADNALTVAKLVQVTFGDQTKYVVSGTEGTEEKTLLSDNLNVEKIKDDVVAIPRTDSKLDDNEIKVGTKVVVVPEGFDFEAAFGANATVYVNSDDEVVDFNVNDTVDVDAITYDGSKIKLVDADASYELANNAAIYIDGTKSNASNLGSSYGYGKVVLNSDDEIKFLEVYSWDDYQIVEKVEDNILFAYGNELDLEDYTIVKEGKTITVDDLEKGDVLFYNTTAEYAEVFNKSVTGAIGHVFVDTIDVDGTEYAYTNPYFSAFAKYIDANGDLVAFANNSKAQEVAESMQDEGNVTVFVDRSGDMVYLSGDLGTVATTSFYSFVTKDIAQYMDRTDEMWTLEVLNNKGEKVTYDFKDSDVRGATPKISISGTTLSPWSSAGTTTTDFQQNDIVKVEVDSDGVLKSLTKIPDPGFTGSINFSTDSSYYNGDKINKDAVVFLGEDYFTAATPDVDDIEVSTFEDLDFDKITDAKFYVVNNAVVAIAVKSSTRGTAETFAGVATAVGTKTTGDIGKLELVVDGSKDVYYTKKSSSLATVADAVYKNEIVEVAINDTTGDIDGITTESSLGSRVVSGTATITSVTNKTLDIGGATGIKLGVNAVIVDATDSYKTISFSSLKSGDTVKALRVATGSVYTDLIVRTVKAPSTTPISSANTITSNYIISNTNTITVTLESGLNASDYVVQFEKADGTVDASTTFTSGAALPSVSLTSNTNYTVKVVKVSDGSVLVSKNIFFQ
ncbi:S-layer homology domain-containing protein [Tepidibacillus sp. HK-1]|uniref:S-layer homology domain-containing protein n=1 Tax=Tepidibacillus sp. HK-1 TaxID=1883407 RepID=UPI000853ECF9|nr:S-layer homology domain-containing protein [Tepidibacillus sp. HK-1]GBF12287.1 surface layer protein precursor [Tepidibacillus sp. HK-1]